MASPLRYVALGDSYTIGTSVSEAGRWPNQLVRALAAAESLTSLELVANLAVNGATSADVIGVQLPRIAALRPDFVSLLIGVNDVVRRVPAAVYERNLEVILDALVALVGRDGVLALTTPDYTVTPAGSDYGNPVAQAAAIRQHNRILAAVAGDRGVTVVDIHDVSLRAATERDLVARDGLHPSGAQYALWVARIAPVVARLLVRRVE